jgi:Tol biopolymer transport system component
MIKFLHLLSFFFFSGMIAFSQTYSESPSDFFFSDEVGDQPMLMSPGFISSGLDEAYGTLGPDGDEFYYCLRKNGMFSVIMATRFHDGFWSYPEVVSFSGNYLDTSPFVSPDGEFLFFASNRPAQEGDGILDWNIWSSKRGKDGQWLSAELMLFSKDDRNEVSVSVDTNGVIYFSADYQGTTLTMNEDALDIFFVQPNEKGAWTEAVRLPESVNSELPEKDPAISPDGKCLVFSSSRMGGEGTSDLYVSYKVEGEWTEAVSLGSKVNSGAYEGGAAFTSDGKLLIFTSSVPRDMPHQLKYSSIKKWLLGPGNGAGDIWYMDASIILKE